MFHLAVAKQPASPSAHPQAAAARRAPLAKLVFPRVRLRLTRQPPLAGLIFQKVISENTVLSEYNFFGFLF